MTSPITHLVLKMSKVDDLVKTTREQFICEYMNLCHVIFRYNESRETFTALDSHGEIQELDEFDDDEIIPIVLRAKEFLDAFVKFKKEKKKITCK